MQGFINEIKDSCFLKSSLRVLRAFAVIAFVVSAAAGCKSKPKFIENRLPLPPGVDSGLYEGQFVQAEYGFGFPVPAKWNYLRLSADQEVDEVGRFSDNSREVILRMSVQLRDGEGKFSARDWADAAELDLKNHQSKIKKRGSSSQWKTADSGNWTSFPFRLTDVRGNKWVDEEWVLAKDDMLIGAHLTMPQNMADMDKGKKLLKAVQASLTQIHWYTPIGPRGISVERFELRSFTERFCRALESRSASKVGSFFDEMYPERAKWNAWYQQAVTGDPASFELKAELAGMVINGDYAYASFALTRKDKGGSKPVKWERNFKLSKKEGSWEITGSMDKN